MPLPRQAQHALEQANATLEAANAPAAPPIEPDPPPAPPPADPVVIAATPPAPTPAAPAVPEESWEQKYRSLQGQHRGFQRQIQDLTQEVQRLQTPAPAPTPAPTEPPRAVADPKDVEAFGLDMVSMVQRVAEQFIGGARQAIEARFDGVEQDIATLRQQVQGTSQTVAVSAEQQFFEKLTKLVPQWEQINQMPEFLAFLAEPDPIYGVRRQAALDDAQAKWDSDRAANVFKAFIGTLAKPPAAPPSESPTPRGAGSPPPAPAAEKPVLTQAQVDGFYADVRRGKYRGNSAEQARLEGIINAALAEGRIR